MTDARDLFFSESIPSAIPELADLPTVTPVSAPTWVLYKPDPTDPLFIEPAGIAGEWDETGSATKVAEDTLTQHAADHADWIVQVYRADGRLRAWAEWEGGQPVTHLIHVRKADACTDCGAEYDHSAGQWREPGEER